MFTATSGKSFLTQVEDIQGLPVQRGQYLRPAQPDQALNGVRADNRQEIEGIGGTDPDFRGRTHKGAERACYRSRSVTQVASAAGLLLGEDRLHHMSFQTDRRALQSRPFHLPYAGWGNIASIGSLYFPQG